MEISANAYASLLRRFCNTKCVTEGMRVHHCIVSDEHDHNSILRNRLVHIYGHCKSLKDAYDVFHRVDEPNIFSWTVMIKVLFENESTNEAFSHFRKMMHQCTFPNDVSLVTVISACANVMSLTEGKRIHVLAMSNSSDVDIVVSSALVNMYSKCHCVEDFKKVFDNMSDRNVVSWNSMISGSACNKWDQFKQMCSEGVLPTKVTYIIMLDASEHQFKHINEYKQIHTCVSGTGMVSDVALGTSLVNMYSKFGWTSEAEMAFDMISDHNDVSWNSIIRANVLLGQDQQVIKHFRQMQSAGYVPNRFTIATALSSFVNHESLCQALHMHSLIVASSLEIDVVIGNALINMYGKCTALESAEAVFATMLCRDVVSWNSILAALARYGKAKHVIQMFQQMLLECFIPDEVTFVSILSVCTFAFANIGKHLHVTIVARGCTSDTFLITALIDMYGKNGDPENASEVLDENDTHDVVMLTSMISSCAQHGLYEQATQLYHQMQQESIIPNKATAVSMLELYANQSNAANGKRIHALTTASGLLPHISVCNALINMYTKCYYLKRAWDVFKGMAQRDIVTWTAMIAGHARLGQWKACHDLFQSMKLNFVVPNKVTFIHVLDACSHGGYIDEAYYYFANMLKECCLIPEADHFNCMIDLLGRAGRLREINRMIDRIPFSCPPLLWLTLLSACRIHLDLELGKIATHCLYCMEPESDVPFGLLSNLYSALGHWEEVSRIKMFVKGLNQGFA